MKRLLALAIVVVVTGLAACQEQPPVTRPEAPVSSSLPEATFVPDQPDLSAQKRAAGIADCPVSDPEVAAHPEGLPDVTLPCLGGGKGVRLSGLRGEPLVVNVWAQWCGPCRIEAPYLAEVSQELDGQVSFLGVDFSDPQPERAVAFAGEAGWRYPQVADDNKDVQAPLSMVGPPLTVLVDANGKIVYQHRGVISSADQLRTMINENLGVG